MNEGLILRPLTIAATALAEACPTWINEAAQLPPLFKHPEHNLRGLHYSSVVGDSNVGGHILSVLSTAAMHPCWCHSVCSTDVGYRNRAEGCTPFARVQEPETDWDAVVLPAIPVRV